MESVELGTDMGDKLYGAYVELTFGGLLDQAVQVFPQLIDQIRNVIKEHDLNPDMITFILKPGTFGWKFIVKKGV